MPWTRPSASRETPERVLRTLRRPRRQARAVDLVADRRPVAARLAGRATDRGVRRRQAVACDPVCRQLEALDAEPGQSRPDGVRVRACVEQRAEQHVPGDAGDAVDIQQPAHAPAPARAIRAAIVPAPNPSSMLTTATPAAHEHSIASSAATPEKAAP